MNFDRVFGVDHRARYRKLLLAGTALAYAALFHSAAQAQSIWGGTGAATATSDYNTGTNWSTNPVAPTTSGTSAQFDDGTGGSGGPASTAVNVSAPVTTDSWTFNAASQSYTVTGSAVTFSNAATLTNNASAGQAISIANNMTGTTLSQADASTLTVSGTNSFTTTTVSAGTLANTGSLTSTVGITSGGTFSNSLTVTGAVSNAGTFNNNAAGKVSGLLTNTAGTTTNAGQLNGGVAVSGGTVTNSNTVTHGVTVSGTGTYTQSAGTTSGGLINSNIVNANGGAINGAIANNTAGVFTVGGPVTANNTFTNNGTAQLNVTGGNFTGITTLTNNSTNANGIVVAAGKTLSLTSISNNAGAFIQNSGTLTATGGFITNTGTINNLLPGSVINGFLVNNNTATINTQGTINGPIQNNNAATINAQGTINGVSNNNTSVFTVTGNLAANNSVVTNDTAKLIVSGGNFTGITTLANFSTNANGVVIASGKTLSATFISNGAGAFIQNSGTLTGTFISNGAGAFIQNSGTLTATNGNGAISNGGTINNLLPGSVINGGLVNFNAGTVNAQGTINGLIVNNNTSVLTVTGNLVGNDLFVVNDTAKLAVTGGNFTGLTSLNNGSTNANGVVVATGNTLSATTITNNQGAFIQNSGTLTAVFVDNFGTLNNLLATSIINGALLNVAGTTTNAGTINGFVNVFGGTVFNSGTVVKGVDVFGTGTYTQTAGTTSGGLTNNSIVNANGGAINGAVDNRAGGTFNVGGTVTGNSTFNNSAATSRLLVNSGSYTVTGLITNSGTNAAGGILVAAGATLNANGGITNNAGATIVNNGIAQGNVANAGIVNNNLIWTGTVSNSGTFNNSALGTVSGLLTNTAGTTTNDGTLNGATVTGGTLTGQGLINGATTVASGGTFAPGNATPGTSMSLTGSLALQSGAFYLVQINPTTSTLANVTGTATPGGATVQANFTNGSYIIGKQYLILHTTAGVTGTFDPTVVNTNLAVNFGTSLSYSSTDAFLNLTAALGAQQSLPANQRNVANAIDNFFNNGGGPMSPGIAVLFGLTGSNLSSALTQASGETATGSQQTTFNAMMQFLELLLDPFIDGRGAAAAPPSGASPYAKADSLAYASRKRTSAERDAYAMFTKAPLAQNYDPHWSVWAAGFGGAQTTDGNTAQGSNNTTSRIFGMAAGADYIFSPRTIAGFALAGGGTNFTVANGGSGRSDLFQAGAFIRHTVGAAYISGALAYGWQDITTNRTVTIAGIDQLQARFNANAFSGRVEGGYRFVKPWLGGIGITPYAAAQFTTFNLPSYAESVLSGANTFALAYGAKSVTDTRSELGLRADKSFAMPNGVLTLRGRLAWAHDYNPDRSIGATFQTLPGASFTVGGAAQAADSALTSASIERKWINGWSAAGTFEGEFSNVTASYAGKGVVRYAW